jgi:hypothetical protein
MGMLTALATMGDVAVPFIVVAERRQGVVRVRLRSG